MHRSVANIVRYITAPDETHQIICQGREAAEFLTSCPAPVLAARVLHIPEPASPSGDRGAIPEPATASHRAAGIQLLPQAPPEIVADFSQPFSRGAGRSHHVLYGHQPQDKQEILEDDRLSQRLERCPRHLASELEVLR